MQLRKAERRNDDLKVDCEDLEEQVSQLSSELRHAHEDLQRLGGVEAELATAKQISIKLHDECERLNAQCAFYRRPIESKREAGPLSDEASLPSHLRVLQFMIVIIIIIIISLEGHKMHNRKNTK